MISTEHRSRKMPCTRTWMEMTSLFAAAWRRDCSSEGGSTISTVSTLWASVGKYFVRIDLPPKGELSLPLLSFSWPKWSGRKTLEFKTRRPALSMSKSEGSRDGWCIKWLRKSPRESSTFKIFCKTGLFSKLVSNCKSVETWEKLFSLSLLQTFCLTRSKSERALSASEENEIKRLIT